MEAKKLYPALFKMTQKEGIFSGILHENGCLVSTNKIVLAEVKFDYDLEHEGKVLSREGVDLTIEHGNFIKYESVIPDKYTMEKYDGQISIKELTLACKNIIGAKNVNPTSVLQIGIKYYAPEELVKLLNIFEIAGEAPSIYQRDSALMALLKSDNITGVCMEMRILEKDDELWKIFNISQALNYSKPVTNNTKKAFYE